jgi:hypothetical protein
MSLVNIKLFYNYRPGYICLYTGAELMKLPQAGISDIDSDDPCVTQFKAIIDGIIDDNMKHFVTFYNEAIRK